MERRYKDNLGVGLNVEQSYPPQAPSFNDKVNRALIMAYQNIHYNPELKAQLRTRLLAGNLGLVGWTINYYFSEIPFDESKIELGELFNEGVIGLAEAFDKFKLKRNIRFATCAPIRIRRAIHQALVKQREFIRLPGWVRHQIRRFKDTEEKLMQELGRAVEFDEVVAMMQLPDSKSLQSAFVWVISLNKPVGPDEDDEFIDFIPQTDLLSPEEEVLRSERRAELEALLASLLKRSGEIVKSRFGWDGPSQSLAEIGQRHRRSRERINQITQQALKELGRSPEAALLKKEWLS